MLAATYQRRRHVWTLIDGGPESAIYKSTDGGETWTQGDARPARRRTLGRIGLAVSPVRPRRRLRDRRGGQRRAGGIFRSTDGGETWEKRSDYVAAAAMYYGEHLRRPEGRATASTRWTTLHPGHRRRRQDVAARWASVQARGQPRDLDRPARTPITSSSAATAACTRRWDRGRDLGRSRRTCPITQFYRVDVDNSLAVLLRLRRHAGQQQSLGGPSRTLDQQRRSRTPTGSSRGAATASTARVDPAIRTSSTPTLQHGVLVPLRPQDAARPIGIQPQEGKGEPAAALELGQPAHHQPALADAPLLRRQPPVPQRRPRQHVEADQPATSRGRSTATR